MSNATIVRVPTQARDVDAFVRERLLPVVDGQDIGLVHASFITLMMMSMGPPDMTEDEVIQGIETISEYVIMYLSGMRVEPGQVH